ncbi:MAG: DNA-processing protein DprA [Fimbriimonadaceae bacterium]
MSVSRRALILALASTPGVGGKTITRVLTRNDLLKRKPEEMLRLSAEALREEYGFSAKAADTWNAKRKSILKEAMELKDRLDALSVQVVSPADAHYPHHVEEFDDDPPGVLYLYGNAKVLERKTFCVMSSRGTPHEGLETIERWTEEMVLAGGALVSGHDTPEYQRSAVVPLRWGAPRVLVLDRGLFRALGPDLDEEPFRTARLWRYKFDPKTDLVVSPVNPEWNYHPNSNRLRDRLIASLSSELSFVALRKGGNMEKLAKKGLKIGRPVRIGDLSDDLPEWEKRGAELAACEVRPEA